ncbi:LacI family DNA-binding transcriptional regulator [Erwinia persicina]|uniref:LacI family DNA-binding transcriptional regulator n=1 Tax=Erwinia persicina TaxID=55211 RepID=UPI001780F4FC|nr:LacI family DNA-binding transcriptional regulator [Erwinia persicina]MBD8162900.1 LacI family DNA-binding transcriptional regulator [Erwinia persicina]
MQNHDEGRGAAVSKNPTLEDVARLAGLSPMTVSRAINKPQVVRPATVARVMEAIQATGYIPNMLAGGLASKRSRLIAVVVPQINNSMFVDTVQALGDRLAQRGYHMLLCITGYSADNEASIVATILSRRPDGIVLTGIHHSPELRKTILNIGLPVVEIWDLTPTPLDMLVGFSHEKIGTQLGHYCLQKGYLNLGLVWASDRRALQRRKGLSDVMQGQPGCRIRGVNAPVPTSLDAGRQGMRQLLARGERFDAIICSSDTLAQGVIMEAEACGLAVPARLAVIGFGDLAFAAANRPSITTVAIDRVKMGEEAATLLADKIEGQVPAELVIDLGFTLKVRDSG